MRLYSDDGMSWAGLDNERAPLAGECVLSDAPSEEELTAAFPGRPAARLALDREAAHEARRELTRLKIVAGFSSSALGAPHDYPSNENDQLNLSGNVMSAILDGATPGWWTPQQCGDAGGVWDYRPHTDAQIKQVGRDWKTEKLARLAINEQIKAAIEASATPLDIDQAAFWS